jgi:hypothetical protein
MNVLQVPLTEAIYSKIKELSDRERITMESFASSAIAEKIAVISDKDYFQLRFKNKTKKDLRNILSNVPAVEPPEYDRL